MKFSIVTISYNQARFLEQAILSVRSQTDANVEHIIVDPGSTDGSREIIEKYRDRIAHVIYDRDCGPADGLNRGFAKASGDWFGCLNADDFYLPGALARAEKAITRTPNSATVVGNGYLTDEAGCRLCHTVSKRYSLHAFAYGIAYCLHISTLYRADAFRAIGGFNPENTFTWDSEILVDLAQAGYRIAHIPEDIGVYRVYPETISSRKDTAEAIREQKLALAGKALGRGLTAIDRWLLAPPYRLLWRLIEPRRNLRMLYDRLHGPYGIPAASRSAEK